MNEKPKRKKRLDSPEPTAIIRELMAQPGIKKVRVFRNGDPYHQGVQMVINDRQIHDLDIFLRAVTNRIDLPFGAKKLYTSNGTLIKDIRAIKDGKDYVASSGLFTPLPYGGQRDSIQAPEKHHEEHREEKEREIPLHHLKKKVKKIKKKKEQEHSPQRTDEKPSEIKLEKHEEEGEKHGEVRSVSRYAHRPPTRAESKMHWKDTSIDETEHEEHEHESHHNHEDHHSEAESEREEILRSEIQTPSNDLHQNMENLNIHETHEGVVNESHEEAKETKVKTEKEIISNVKEAEKQKKSVYHWGNLNSFTKNIESLLKRKD